MVKNCGVLQPDLKPQSHVQYLVALPAGQQASYVNGPLAYIHDFNRLTSINS